MINAALVGLGWWGQTHVRADAGSDKLRFVRAIDVAPDNARDFAAEYDLELSADYADALGDPAIDAVFLATPHKLHTEQIVAAAAAGKHVFTEKPFAMNKADGERAVAAVADAGVQLGIGHNNRYGSALTEIKRLVEAGTLGQVMHIEANLSHPGQIGIETWRRDHDQAPTGGLVHFGIHQVDMFQWIAGPVVEVYGQTSSFVLDDDTGSVLFKLQSGATAYLGNLMATSQNFHFQVMARDGWARTQGWLDSRTLTVHLEGAPEETRELEPREIDAQVRANDENFAAACEGTETYMFTHDEMVHTAAVLEAIARSVATHQPVAVA